ncbi:histidine kinase, partial [Reticulomyxa filosa]
NNNNNNNNNNMSNSSIYNNGNYYTNGINHPNGGSSYQYTKMQLTHGTRSERPPPAHSSSPLLRQSIQSTTSSYTSNSSQGSLNNNNNNSSGVGNAHYTRGRPYNRKSNVHVAYNISEVAVTDDESRETAKRPQPKHQRQKSKSLAGPRFVQNEPQTTEGITQESQREDITSIGTGI